MTERAEAIIELLALPCPPDLDLRHHWTQDGDPLRFELLRSQPNVYAQWACHEHHDISEAKVIR